MLEKINRQFSIFNFQFSFIWLLVIGLLVYSRFINLGWGLPYPMHPDERNMVTAIQQLNCRFPTIDLNLPKSMFGDWEPVTSWIKVIGSFDLFNCFNPHFFAYGQFPLYLGYIIVFFLKFFDGNMGFPISFQEGAVALRIISAIASVVNFIVIIKIINIITKKKSYLLSLISYLFVVLSPYAIQLSHFGTTESLLMLFYSSIIYYSLLFIDKKISILSFVIHSSLMVGLSLATKVSSLIFLSVPFLTLLFNSNDLKLKTSISNSKNMFMFFAYRLVSKLIDLIILVFLSFLIFFIFSPHNLINYTDFIGSINYESEVALGKSLVFYTRQFFAAEPFYFQFEKIFPYALGWPVYIMGLIGLISLDLTNRKINLLRFGFLVYFIPSAIVYAKWSRFMAPIFPLILIFAIIFLIRIKVINVIKIIIITIAVIPGIAYLSVYQNADVRFQASEWIYKNIPSNSYVLSETANVVDIPVELESYKVHQVYQVVSFNFYDLDESPELQSNLRNHLQKADYIFVPSRRLFANHTCQGNFQFSIFNFQSNLKSKCKILKNKYPVLNKYYEDLFSGKLGFEKVAEFSSGLNDEQAEETWTVFDHPVIRIYKKVKS